MHAQTAYPTRLMVPFEVRVAQLRAELEIKRMDRDNALLVAEKVTGKAREMALANAMRLKREAADLAFDVARLGGRL
jgi:hypothetical protein